MPELIKCFNLRKILYRITDILDYKNYFFKLILQSDFFETLDWEIFVEDNQKL
jgi:hypothetical protein